MAKLFRYYDDWKTEVFTSVKCGWKGTFEEEDFEIHDQLLDSSCPDCDYSSTPMFAIDLYQTLEDMENNWDKLTENEKAIVRSKRQFLNKLEELSLKSVDELPDIEDPSIIIQRDFMEDEKDRHTVLKFRERDLAGTSRVWSL